MGNACDWTRAIFDGSNLVSWEPPPDRRELAALFAEDDKLRAEHDEWMAQRQAADEAPVSETLVRKDYGGNAWTVAATAEEPSAFDELQKDTLATVIAALRAEWQADIDNAERRLANLITRMAFPGERAEEETYALKNRFAQTELRIRQRELETAKFERQVDNLAGEVVEIKALVGRVLKKFHEIERKSNRLNRRSKAR